jgi:organic hydroperoxide reductase OsmC/OhrA
VITLTAPTRPGCEQCVTEANVTLQLSEDCDIRTESKPLTVSCEWHGSLDGAVIAPRRGAVAVTAETAQRQAWTPEELFLSAVNSCLMITLQRLALAAELPIVAYSSECEPTLDARHEVCAIVAISIRPTITIADSRFVSRVARALEEAQVRCLATMPLTIDLAVEPHLLVTNIPSHV